MPPKPSVPRCFFGKSKVFLELRRVYRALVFLTIKGEMRLAGHDFRAIDARASCSVGSNDGFIRAYAQPASRDRSSLLR